MLPNRQIRRSVGNSLGEGKQGALAQLNITYMFLHQDDHIVTAWYTSITSSINLWHQSPRQICQGSKNTNQKPSEGHIMINHQNDTSPTLRLHCHKKVVCCWVVKKSTFQTHTTILQRCFPRAINLVKLWARRFLYWGSSSTSQKLCQKTFSFLTRISVLVPTQLLRPGLLHSSVRIRCISCAG